MIGFTIKNLTVPENVQESWGIDLNFLTPYPGFSTEINLGTLNLNVGVNEMESTCALYTYLMVWITLLATSQEVSVATHSETQFTSINPCICFAHSEIGFGFHTGFSF